jgi:pilus assembly protein CpaF
MSPDYTRPPWITATLPTSDQTSVAHDGLAVSAAAPSMGRPPLPEQHSSTPAAAAGAAVDVHAEELRVLTDEEYKVVDELRDRVSTRLTVEDKNYAPAARRELTKTLIRDEYDQWLLHQNSHGRVAPAVTIEDTIFAAVLAELDGLGRLAPLLVRPDVEDIHFEGSDPTMLRLKSGELVPGAPIASSDAELEQLLRAIGARSGDGQTSREFSSASPILNVRLKGVTDLGARLQAAMDVLPRPSGVIRVHRFSDPSLDDLRAMNMIDTPIHAFLHHAILAGASPLVSGNPGRRQDNTPAGAGKHHPVQQRRRHRRRRAGAGAAPAALGRRAATDDQTARGVTVVRKPPTQCRRHGRFRHGRRLA